MTRRLLNLLTALSLVLFVAVAAVWVRSHWRWDQLVINTPHRSFQIALKTGGVSIHASWVERRVNKWEARREGPFPGPQPLFHNPNTTLNRLGFLYARKARPDHVIGGLAFPYWCVVLACAVFPALRLPAAARRMRRTRPNLCRSCGYDLTGNVSGVCPECGAVAPSPRP